MSCSRSDDEWAMAALIARYLGPCLFFLKASPTLRKTPLPTLGIVTNPFFFALFMTFMFSHFGLLQSSPAEKNGQPRSRPNILTTSQGLFKAGSWGHHPMADPTIDVAILAGM